MNDYQRNVIEIIPMDWMCRECSYPQVPKLPQELLKAAQLGNVAVLKDYQAKDGNVSAVHKYECLLSRACAEGQVEVVKYLLECSDVHLNFKFNEVTPLTRSFRNGHMECVKLLLDASVTCNIQVENDWEAVIKCLNMQPDLHHRSATRLLRSAMHAKKWDVLQLILAMKYHFVKEDLYLLVLAAIDQDQWEIVYSVLKRNFYGKSEITNEAFAIAVNLRNWESVRNIMQVIEKDLKFDIAFVEAAFAGKLPEVERMLADEQSDPQKLNGNMLVVSAGGICHSIAVVMTKVWDVYTATTLSTSLFLAALGYHEDLLLKLLYHPEAGYGFYELHHIYEVLVRLPYQQKREGPTVTEFTNYLRQFVLPRNA